MVVGQNRSSLSCSLPLLNSLLKLEDSELIGPGFNTVKARKSEKYVLLCWVAADPMRWLLRIFYDIQVLVMVNN